MKTAKILRIYLDDEERVRAEAGQFNIMTRIKAAFESRRFRVEFVKNSAAERAKSTMRNGFSLFHMDEPFHARALTLRRAYFYPFWRIEASAKRWEWEIAKTEFKGPSDKPKAVGHFCNYWRRQHFPELEDVARDNSVYVPLQGRLLEKRSFQTQNPLDMIRTTLAYEHKRKIVLGLHPKETYLPEELTALKDLIDREPRLHLSSEPMVRLLQRCDYVVTENSSVVLSGYYLHRPAVLFADIDFHHIAANVRALGAEAAIAQAPDMTPDFDGYMYWFLKETALNGGAETVEDKILAMVQARGWRV